MSSTQTETRSIVVEFDLPRPAERVWHALTDPRLIEQWLMPNDFKAETEVRPTRRFWPVSQSRHG